METDNLYINNALDWLKRAVDSLVSHKRTDEGTGFIRSSKQIIPEQKEGIFYTATFQAYSALLESAETYEAGATDPYIYPRYIWEKRSILNQQWQPLHHLAGTNIKGDGLSPEV